MHPIQTPPGPAPASAASPSHTGHPADLTTRAVARWLRALPAARYDVRLVDRDKAGAVLRSFTPATLIRAVPWLRSGNRLGRHVYARPLAARHVLVDDLDADGLDALRADHRPALVVETSPHNFQAWLTLAGTEIPAAVAGMAARLLAGRYGGDPGAASAGQLGRLPGFTNRKPMYERRDGTFPYVLVRCCRPGSDPAGAALLAEVRDRLARNVSPPAAVETPAICRHRWRLCIADPAAEMAEAERRVVATLPPGTPLDRSRLDAAIARRLLGRGAGREEVAAVLRCGARARSLGPARAEAYVQRTLAAMERVVPAGGGLITAGPRGGQEKPVGAEGCGTARGAGSVA